MSTISTNPFTQTSAAPPAALPLEDGERMDVDEFMRRWEGLPAEWQEKHKRIELIHGVVRIMPPISGGNHGLPHFNFGTFLGVYHWATPGVLASAPASVILGKHLMPEPDNFLAIDPKNGGRIRLNEKGYFIGAPELFAEISASTIVDDLGVKKETYRLHGVNEYVVWRTKENAIDWFILRGEQYEPLATDDGVYRSETFPGLWLAASSMVAGNSGHVHQVLQEGLASPEHAAFVERLATQKSP